MPILDGDGIKPVWTLGQLVGAPNATHPPKDPLVIMKELPRTSTTPVGQIRVRCLASNRAVWVVRVPVDGFRENMGEIQKRQPAGIEGVVVTFDNPKGRGICMGVMEVTKEQKQALDELAEQAETQGRISYPLPEAIDDVIRHAIVEMMSGLSMRPEGAIKLWKQLKSEGKVSG
jgi:hypothetical protein